MEYFYPLIGKCALTKPKEQGGGREIQYRGAGKAAEPRRSGDTGGFLLQSEQLGGRDIRRDFVRVQGMALEDWSSVGPMEEPVLTQVMSMHG